MRSRAIAGAALIFMVWSCESHALNWRSTTRSDHKSLDVVVRRLENNGKGDVAACLHHLRPMLTRHGGPIGWGSIQIGSDEELDLICAQHGNAQTSLNRQEVGRDISIGVVRWLKNQVFAIFLGLGPGLTAVVVLAVLYRYRGKVIRAFDRAVEEAVPDKEVRKAKFADPLIQKEHARLKSSQPQQPS